MTTQQQDLDRLGFRPFIPVASAIALLFASSLHAAIITVGTTGCDYTSIQAALNTAKSGDEIRLRTQGFNENINVARSLTIRGGFNSCSDSAPSQLTTITGPAGAGDSVVELTSPGITVDLSRVVVNGGEDDGTGGGIDTGTGSTLILADVTVALNESKLGGGIYVGPSSTLRRGGNVTITTNSATRGGGVFIDASAEIEFGFDAPGQAEIVGNDALSGGGIHAAAGSSIESTSSTIAENLASSGGGIYIGGPGGATPVAPLIVLKFRTVIRDNQALAGGGLFLDEAGGHHVTLGEAMSCSGNEAIDGGCVNIQGTGRLELLGSIIENRASRNGGGVFAQAGEISLADSSATLSNNSASAGGGAYVTSTDLLVGGRVVSNRATHGGGGVRLVDGSLFVIGSPLSRVIFRGNVSEQGDGGAIHVENGDLIAEFAQIGIKNLGNSASLGLGGGIFHTGSGNVELTNSRVSGNSANSGGGIFYRGSGRLYITANIAPNGVTPSRGAPTQCDITRLGSGRYCSEILGNTASFGGGIYLDSSPPPSGSAHAIEQTALIENASDLGSAIAALDSIDVWVRGALLHGNRDINSGPGVGVIRMIGDTAIVLNHSTLVDNDGVATVLSAAPSLGNEVTDNLFYGNTADAEGYLLASSIFVCNLSRDGTMPAGSGLGDVAPRFIETSRGPYRLSDLSPALDACGPSGSQDIDGLSRPIGAGADAGAFEGAWGIPELIFGDSFE